MPEFLKTLPEAAQSTTAVAFILKLCVSTILGAVIAFHVTALDKIRKKPKRMTIAKAQILICIAGTVMILVIGNSVARAFGLFGLGSFIRFRTSVKSAMDTAIIFILIAIGMAVGVGMYVPAVLVVGFLYVILIVLDKIRTVESENAAPAGPDNAPSEGVR
ncbi:MAG: hypothetical protein A2268_07800 [Candidatus Raymondbacteria bacterium RifOxyA12_full_50_37]|uniref:DUF4956 domain-containing protein n=1 Tax=Candidatus Raymondbacteria bacterium RIFOXYD12_FULL_49_13 TaxID=1817890 RepID=A0A1F7F7S1_UNCRA|nr:MAG: hypothetical protein A2268_07800 [Candidatus Raymondbacteria bacterium RifOxyA12_full_50_37]OGJ88956.1 MAG: hypothetical protein A2350_12450 [Candidatus Raymondbacteria bacterium RifOxyB12_full_50_8]OGJ89609.1 MAG: hypothetical protein A2248_09520 [Candidatus Raymondbacteria bacterium RIFOXYA2_FULL_49_16]OGJ95513.1 MAG: hypothetical protein A2487_16995 [Candidatus Raymondbacteria bacterium RifOxyC12_full_50_8]OGK02628.1 MAG: hypothetical protein A2519_11235 [Candidatus Raymondbacteria b